MSVTESKLVCLDFGCGTGRSLEILDQSKLEVFGIDESFEMLESCREQGLVNPLLQGNENLAVKSASIDIVQSANVLSELPTAARLRTFFSEVSRVLKPGGTTIHMVAHPEAYGKVFQSFGYPDSALPKRGSRYNCYITPKPGESIKVLDTYWTKEDYQHFLEDQTELELVDLLEPKGIGSEWEGHEEENTSPFLILVGEKVSDSKS